MFEIQQMDRGHDQDWETTMRVERKDLFLKLTMSND